MTNWGIALAQLFLLAGQAEAEEERREYTRVKVAEHRERKARGETRPSRKRDMQAQRDAAMGFQS